MSYCIMLTKSLLTPWITTSADDKNNQSDDKVIHDNDA